MIDWTTPTYDSTDWLQPLLSHCATVGAFQVKMGPPIAARRWNAATVKQALADADASRPEDTHQPTSLSEIPADWSSPVAPAVVEALRSAGGTQLASSGAGFADVQPRFVYCVSLQDRTLDDVFAGFNQLWRRNVRKADKSGVVVRLGSREDLADFHRVYVETAKRDHFTPRGRVYFERMWDALNSATDDYHGMTLHIAEHEGHVAAATIMIRVGDRAWYSYGASTTADRDVRPSNALQWDMITRAHAAGCSVYDLRGISDTLDPANHLLGLVRFKVGSGGYAQEYIGEWDFALRKTWARAYAAYSARART